MVIPMLNPVFLRALKDASKFKTLAGEYAASHGVTLIQNSQVHCLACKT